MANIKFTEFPSATVVGSMDIIPIVQDGANKKTTASVFQTYIGTLFVNLTGTQTITGSKTFSSQLISSVATGTAPFTVASTTKVTNLNADLLDGLSSAAFQTVLTNPITGTGTTNYLPKFTGASALGNSLLQETTNAIGLNVTPSAWGSLSKSIQIGNKSSLFSFNNGTTDLGFNVFWNSTNTDYNYIENGFVSLYRQSSGQHIWLNAPSGTAGNAISFTQAMTLDAAGNLGIGTATPAFNGTDSGLQILKSSVAATLRLTSSTSNFDIANDSAGVYQIVRSNDSLYFGTNNIIRLTIASSGEATFSSSVTTGGDLTVANTGANYSAINTGAKSTFGLPAVTNVNLAIGVSGAGSLGSIIQSRDNVSPWYLSLNPFGGQIITANATDTGEHFIIGGTARVSGALDVRATNTFLGSVKGYIYTTDDQINCGFSTNATSALNFNYYGYDQGFSQFRDFDVYNGKGTRILNIVGSSGAATFSAGVALSGATAPASGIEFPSTQVASASANNLDDYEEGTFTATLTPITSGSITLSVNTCSYTKIGRQVTIRGQVNVGSTSLPVGAITVLGGLPFLTINSISGRGAGVVQYFPATGAGSLLQNYQVNNSIELGLILDSSTVLSGSEFYIALTYFV